MNRLKTLLLAMILAATFAPAAIAVTNTAANPPVSSAERAKIEEVVREYLIRQPEVLVEALQNFQRKQMEEAQQTVKSTQQSAPKYVNNLFHQANDPVAGNPNGDITIVEFFDYQCPHCLDMAPVIAAIIKANPNVRIIFKEFPIRGPMSDFAARAALAANKQGKYYILNHALLTAKQPLTEESIFAIAKNAGLDVDKLKKDMNDASINNQLKNTMKLAQDLKLFGTPAFFIGKTDAKTNSAIQYVPGQVDQKQMQSLIDKATT